jgi:hypothetical protein
VVVGIFGKVRRDSEHIETCRQVFRTIVDKDATLAPWWEVSSAITIIGITTFLAEESRDEVVDRELLSSHQGVLAATSAPKNNSFRGCVKLTQQVQRSGS